MPSTSLEEEEKCVIQELSALLERMTQMSKIGVGSAPLHYRSLQKQRIKSIHMYGILTRRQQITIMPKAMAGENSVPIMEQTYSIAIQSDASVWAGGSLSREKDWKSLEHRRKTSSHECPRIKGSTSTYPIISEKGQLPGQCLLLQVDNTTAVAYLNKWRGTTHTAALEI